MVEAQISSWARRYPNTLRFFDRLNAHGVRWGLFAGGQVQFLPGARNIDDHDILTDEAGFEGIASMPNVVVTSKKSVGFRASDGCMVEYATDEATIVLDDKMVQVMNPVDMKCGDSKYRLSMTELASRHRLVRSVGGVVVYAANPVDTVFTKAILQRPAPKHDIPDIKALAAHYDLWENIDYAEVRAREIGVDPRMERVLVQHAGFPVGMLAVKNGCREPAFV